MSLFPPGPDLRVLTAGPLNGNFSATRAPREIGDFMGKTRDKQRRVLRCLTHLVNGYVPGKSRHPPRWCRLTDDPLGNDARSLPTPPAADADAATAAAADANARKGVREFEAHRGLLFSIAYRMLGSATDAEDVVQDAWLRYSSAPPEPIRSVRA